MKNLGLGVKVVATDIPIGQRTGQETLSVYALSFKHAISRTRAMYVELGAGLLRMPGGVVFDAAAEAWGVF